MTVTAATHFNKLSQKLGIDFEEEITDLEEGPDGSFSAIIPSSVNGNALTVPNPTSVVVANRDSDEEVDYQEVRNNYRKLASMGEQATADLLRVAQLTSEPRAYEVVATLIKSLNETNKNLYGIHEESKRSKELSKQAQNKPENQGTYIDKAVFVGNQADLLNKVKNNGTDELRSISQSE